MIKQHKLLPVRNSYRTKTIFILINLSEKKFVWPSFSFFTFILSSLIKKKCMTTRFCDMYNMKNKKSTSDVCWNTSFCPKCSRWKNDTFWTKKKYSRRLLKHVWLSTTCSIGHFSSDYPDRDFDEEGSTIGSVHCGRLVAGEAKMCA
jgi:hypothetical protein